MHINKAAPWLGALVIAAGVPMDAQVSSTAAVGGGPGLGVAGTFEANVAPPPAGAFDFAVHGVFDGRRMISGTEHGAGRIESSIARRWGVTGATIGVGAERGTNFDGARVQPLLNASVRREIGRIVISLGTEAHSARLSGQANAPHLQTFAESAFNDTTRLWRHWVDSSMAGDSGRAARALQWADVQARAMWASDRVTLDARLGVQPKLGVTPRTVWARATATIGLSTRLAFVAAAGTEPSRGWIGMPSSRFTSFGIRVAGGGGAARSAPPSVQPPVSAFGVQAAGGDLYVLTVRLAGAHTVEISGDFTGWHALPMRRTSRETWEVTTPLAPGTHRANVRIDGDAWIAPPGMSSTTDEFNGTVGIFVVR